MSDSTPPHPPDVRHELESWLDGAMRFLSDHTVHSKYVWRDTRYPDGGVITEPQLIMDIPVTVAQYGEQLEALPQTATILSVVEQHPELAQAFLTQVSGETATNDRDKIHNLCRWLLVPLVREYLLATQASKDLDPLTNLHDLIHQAAYAPGDAVVKWRILFWNFVVDDPALLVDPDALVRPSSEEEFNEVRDRHIDSPMMFHGLVFGENTLGGVLEVRHKASDLPDPEGGQFHAASQAVAKAVLLALRLVRPEWLAIESTLMDCENPFVRLPSGQRSWGPDESANLGASSTYHLDSSSAAEVQQLWPLVFHALNDQELHVPIARFFDSYGRRERYDRHLDYWMALESLFVASESENVTQIVKASIPYYLCSSQNERNETRRLIGEAYDLRSRLIHGNAGLFPWDGSQPYHMGKEVAGYSTRDHLIDSSQVWTQEALRKRIQELDL